MKKSASNGERILATEEEQLKVHEVRKLIGQLSGKAAVYCSDSCILRYLIARNWNVKKAAKMLKESLKWRAEYKPEEIRWAEIAHEAETGKIYRSNYYDKYERPVLVLRPRCQNTKSTKGQIRYFVYCMENAILNLGPNQEKMVWLIDFHGFNVSHLSLKQTKETAYVLQNHYPERLGLAILYNPPKIFEPFWKVARAVLEPKTYNKVKFVYSDEPNTVRMMENFFDMDQIESAFGGKDSVGFDISKYAERMEDDDMKMSLFWGQERLVSVLPEPPASLDTVKIESDLETSDDEKIDYSLLDSGIAASGGSTPEIDHPRLELEVSCPTPEVKN